MWPLFLHPEPTLFSTSRAWKRRGSPTVFEDAPGNISKSLGRDVACYVSHFLIRAIPCSSVVSRSPRRYPRWVNPLSFLPSCCLGVLRGKSFFCAAPSAALRLRGEVSSATRERFVECANKCTF